MKTKKLTYLKRNFGKLIVALMFFAIFNLQPSNAQIIFKDLLSDKTVAQYEGMYSRVLDLDEDGLNELMFYANDGATTTADWIGIQALNEGNAEIFGTTDDTNYFPTPLDSGATIDATGNWSNFTNKEMILRHEDGAVSIGPWVDNNFHYIGVRFKIGIDWHYAWIKIGISVKNESAAGQMKSYAYNSVVDGAIAAGDEGSGSGIHDNLISDKIRTYSAEKYLYVDFDGLDNNNAKVKLINILGKEIKNFDVNSRHSKLNLYDIPDGVYIVNIQLGDKIVNRKINVR